MNFSKDLFKISNYDLRYGKGQMVPGLYTTSFQLSSPFINSDIQTRVNSL